MIGRDPLSDKGFRGSSSPGPRPTSVTRMSGSRPASGGPIRPETSVFGPLRTTRSVARGLLLLAAAMFAVATSACPLPVYDVDPELNSRPEVDYLDVSPAFGIIEVVLECGTQPVEFRLSPAASDPDGDELIVYWLVNEKDDFGLVGQSTLDFTFDPCVSPKVAANDDNTLTIEAAILDAQPATINVGGVRKAAQESGVYLLWTIQTSGSVPCLCE